MKTCVIYASYIPDSTKLNVIREFFSTFKNNFSNADFYIGINPGSVINTKDIIQEYGLNCQFSYVKDELNTNTDASAYQSALNLLKNSGKIYDTCWFAHTKGGVNSREGQRNLYLTEMFNKRNEIESLFENHSFLGSWGIRGNAKNSLGTWWKDYNVDSCISICGNEMIPPFICTHVNWSYIETMFVLKGMAIDLFLKCVPEQFFTTKLDPWYFETVIPWIPSRCGYFPYVKNKRCFWDVDDLPNITKKWIEDNNLPHLLPYLNI